MIIIYTMERCPNCRRVKKFCKENDIPFIERDPNVDFKAHARLIVEGLENMPVIQKGELFYECTDVEFLKQRILEMPAND